MNVVKIKIKNYRLLKDFELDLESNLSLVIGKNNTGKTSLLSILEKFIGDRSFKNEFSFDDFNIEFKKELTKLLELGLPNEEDYSFMGISLKLFIRYDEKDDLSNISQFMMDLTPENNTIILGFEYRLTYTNLQRLVIDFKIFEEKEKGKVLAKKLAAKQNESGTQKSDEISQMPEAVLVEQIVELSTENIQSPTPSTAENLNGENRNVLAVEEAASISDDTNSNDSYATKDICHFLKSHHEDYFEKAVKTIYYNIDDPADPHEEDIKFIDVTDQKIQLNRLINFKRISAKREVSNKDPDKSLSSLSSKIYKKTEANERELKAIEDFKDALSDTDSQLDVIYKGLFDIVITKVKQFGGIQPGDSIIEIISTLQHRELLEGNTTVMYRHNKNDSLPEHYNGLGYMNLISMIFEIEILLHEFKRDTLEKPADINLLFIEEPEAHTHPQMQYVFIKNIKLLLAGGIIRNDGEHRKLQTIISTHSSHIVSESDFDDIKYFKKTEHSVVARNLKDLVNEYEIDSKEYKFLKQYLTISRAELFFADKAILIEGDTETIILPTMMKKFDLDEAKRLKTAGLTDEYLALLSQNISIVQVGAHSQVFEKFISFLGIKSLIITDLDSVDADGCACEVATGVGYSNSALSFFFGAASLANLQGYSISDKIFLKKSTWAQDAAGTLCIVYQVPENGYNARSFEDAFLNINKTFVEADIDSFKGLKNRRYFDDTTKNSYYLAEHCINKKTHFALDILYHSDQSFSNWQLPLYIKEGLTWLKQD